MTLSRLGLAIVLAIALLCPPEAAEAATVMPKANPAAAPGDLAGLLYVDQLGFECLREDDIDTAFHLSGKGLRLPRTCLPAPCDAALTRSDLGALIGRAPTEAEWDDYYARYAETCRREVIAFEPDDALPSVAPDTPSDPVRDFWTPLVASYGPNAPIRARLPLPPRRLSGLSPAPIVSGTTTGGGGGTSVPALVQLIGGGSEAGNPTDPNPVPAPQDLRAQFSSPLPPPPPSAVPLPAALWLLGSAALAIVGTRRLRKSS